ncbi:MAG: chalcone isomerase family protein [Steroidobacteraceae bacterium]
MKHAWLICLLATSVCAAQDKTCRDISFPGHVQVSGTDLSLNGLGVRKATFLKVSVYVAALYVVQPEKDPRRLIEADTPQQLVLHFVRNVGVEDVRKGFAEGFDRSSAGQSAGLSARIARLNTWMSDMKSGQQLTFIRLPHAGLQVSVNGVPKGTIEGEDFSRALMSIWLGATPPNPELKSGLLGGECG